MGHRVFLLARAETDEYELFEANNFLPFFWVGLLDEAALAASEKWWHELAQLEAAGDYHELERFTDIWPPLTNLVLDHDGLAHNAARTAAYLRQYAPALLPLHQEFMAWLLVHLPGPDDLLHLDIVALAAFTSVPEYLAGLRAQLAALAAGQTWPFGPLPVAPVDLVGFPGSGYVPPAAEYPQLHALVPPRRPPVAAPPPRAGRWWLWLLGLLAVLGLLLGLTLR